MPMRRSKKKQHPREQFMLKEQLKIEEGVFDNRTMLNLEGLFTHGIISQLEFLTARGKESDVYIASAGERVKEEFVAVKIFRIETSGFANREEYIIGDPRFGRIKGGIFNIVNEWCKKEYGNLKIAESAGVHAPRPYFFRGNVLGMEFIGSDGMPAPMLKNAKLENPAKMLESILSDMRKLYANELVHADVSEYNVLVKDDAPYLIDFGQAVVLGHPNSASFLHRDVLNIIGYFRKRRGIEADQNDAYEYIIGKKRKPNIGKI